MSTTLQDLRNIGYAILKETEASSAYPVVLMDSLLNGAQNSICAGAITDVRSGNQIEKGPLPFLYTDKFYTTVLDSSLSDVAVIGAVTLDLDTTNLLSSGKIWINGNIITYTGKSATQLTGVTGIQFAHLGGSSVSQLFELPTDFASAVNCIYNGSTPLDFKDYRSLFTQLDSYKGNGSFGSSINSNVNTNNDRFISDLPPFYTIIQGQYLLPLQLSVNDRSIHLMYEKIPTRMTLVTDLVTIPDNYADKTIPYIAIGEFLYNRGEEQRGLELLGFGYGKIMEMYSFYTNQNNERLHGQRVRTGKDQIFNI